MLQLNKVRKGNQIPPILCAAVYSPNGGVLFLAVTHFLLWHNMYCETEAPQGSAGFRHIFSRRTSLCVVSTLAVTAAAGSSFSFCCSAAAAATTVQAHRTIAAVAAAITTAADAAAD